MQPTLMVFLFNTLQVQLNNPQNSTLWLPAVLQNMTDSNGNKVLPIQAAQFSNATMTGSGGTTFAQNIANGWYMISTASITGPDVDDHMGIPCPGTPNPNLTMTDVTITGLDNVYLESSATINRIETGYDLTITLQQGYYPATDQVSGVPIIIDGTYGMTQCVCSASVPLPSPPVCVDVPVPIPDPLYGTGTVVANFNQMSLAMDVTLTIQGTGAERTLLAAVSSMTLTPPTTNPLCVPTLTLTNASSSGTVIQMWDGVYQPQTIAALTSSDGVAGLVSSLQNSLNTPQNLGSIGSTLSDVMNKTLASVIGDIAPGSLVSTTSDPTTNPLDQYIFDYMVTALNQSSSKYYAPAVVLFSNNPALDPYSVAEIDLGQVSIGSTSGALSLTGVQITGSSNIVVSPAGTSLSGSTITGTSNIGTLDPPPTLTNPQTQQQQSVPAPPLSLTAELSFQLENAPNPITGSLAVTLVDPTMGVVIDLAGDTVDTLTLTFTALTLGVAPSNMTITLTMDSVFSSMIENYLGLDSTKQNLITQINNAAAANLNVISTTATQVAQAKINSALSS